MRWATLFPTKQWQTGPLRNLVLMVLLGHLTWANAMLCGSLLATNHLQTDYLRMLVLVVVLGHLTCARAGLWGSLLPTKQWQAGPPWNIFLGGGGSLLVT